MIPDAFSPVHSIGPIDLTRIMLPQLSWRRPS
jgi:hypothetical protein